MSIFFFLPTVFAAGLPPTLDAFLKGAVVVAFAAVAVLLLCHRLKIPPLVGLLGTGLLIGPSGLGLVEQSEVVEAFAEIGVVLLLFAIGLELSMAKLKELQRFFLVGGGLQAGFTLAAATLVALGLGFDLRRALFYGCLLVLSSTALVLKIYAERGEMESPQGQASLGILLLQDFLIVPMIILVPVLGGRVSASPLELATRFGGGLLVVGAIFFAARYLMPRVLHQIVRTRGREIFVLGAFGLCLGMAWGTAHLGFSLALGAFLAGILVSESEYSHQVVADVAPLRDLFASIFFVSIGMLVDLRIFHSHAAAVFGLAAAIVVGKALLAGGAVALLRLPRRVAVLSGLGLAQVGEFSFVVMEVGRVNGLLTGDRFQIFLAAAVTTLALTPGLVALAPALAARLGGPDRSAEGARASVAPPRVVVIGYGAGGRIIARVLREVRVPYMVVELNGETVRRAKAEGESITFGDASRREILEHAGVPDAQVLVVAISDPSLIPGVVQMARDLHPAIEIVVRTRRVREIDRLRELGADQVIAEEFETAIEIFNRVLRRLHTPRNVIRAQTRVLRQEGYLALRRPALDAEASSALLDALVEGTVEIYRLRRTSPAVGRSLRDLDLRRRVGASVVAVVRGDDSMPNPSADLELAADDSLVVVGSHDEIERAFDLLASPGESTEESSGEKRPAS